MKEPVAGLKVFGRRSVMAPSDTSWNWYELGSGFVYIDAGQKRAVPASGAVERPRARVSITRKHTKPASMAKPKRIAVLRFVMAVLSGRGCVIVESSAMNNVNLEAHRVTINHDFLWTKLE